VPLLSGHVGYHHPPQVDQVKVEMIELGTVLISFVRAALIVIWLAEYGVGGR
jgi:hypothetical protein